MLRSRYRRELAKAGLAPKVWPSAWSPEHSGHWAGLAPILIQITPLPCVIPFPLPLPRMVWEGVGTPPGLSISEAGGPGVSTSRGNSSLGQAQFGEAGGKA